MARQTRMTADEIQKLMGSWVAPEWVFRFGDRYNDKTAMVELRMKEGRYRAASGAARAEAQWRALALEYAMMRHATDLRHLGLGEVHKNVGNALGLSTWTLRRWESIARGLPINYWPVLLLPKRRDEVQNVGVLAAAISIVERSRSLSASEVVNELAKAGLKASSRTIQRFRQKGLLAH